MKKLLSIFLLLLSLLFISVGFASCRAKLTEEEAIAKVKELVSASYELNVIYFGDGLEFIDDEDPTHSYMNVKEDCPYKTRAELEERTYQIFTEDYALSMITTAFEGVRGANGGVVYPRYSTLANGEDGELTVYKNIEGEKISTYDFNTIEITKRSSRFVIAKIKTTDGVEAQIQLYNQDGEWRVDSATY